MLTFSEQIKERTPEAQRRLYTLFQREVKAGRIPALKLLTKFEVQSTQGQVRKVQDYAFTDEVGQQVTSWIAGQEQPQKGSGFTLEQLQMQNVSDQDLSTLIQQQRQPKKKRKARATKNPKVTVSEEAKAQ